MTSFSDTTLHVLGEAGWFPHRSVSTGMFEAHIARDGYYINDTIRDFLREFGGLTLTPPPLKIRNGKGRINSSPIVIGSQSCSLPFTSHVYWCEDILQGETLIPIGYHNPAEVFMSYSGQLYEENNYEFHMLAGTPREVINKICSCTSIDEKETKLHLKIATMSPDRIEFFEDIQLDKNLRCLLNRSPSDLIPYSAANMTNTLRRLYGLEMGFRCKTYTFDESVAKTVNLLHDLVLLYPDWLPFYITSAKSEKYRMAPFNTIPRSQEMKDIMVDTSWYQLLGSQITLCDIGHNHSNIGKMLEIHLQLSKEDNNNCFWVRFPPCGEETKRITSKEFIKNIFELFMKHWQPLSGFLSPSIPLIKRYISDVLYDVGWFSYFSEEYGSLPNLPDWVQVISLDGQGNYIQIMDELPDYNNVQEFTDFAQKMRELSDITGPWLISRMYPPLD
jgi:hypothetical protein